MLTSQSIKSLFVTHAESHSEDSFYCLVDHAGMPGLHTKLVNMPVAWISLFEGTKEASALEAAPLLFRIETDPRDVRHRQLLAWVCERGTFTSSLILVAAPLPLHELACRLRIRLEGRISENMDVLLRFHDPRIFEELMIVLPKQEKKVFLSAGRRWWFADRGGKLQVVDAEFMVEDGFVPPLNLSVSEEAALLTASEPDQVAQLLRGGVPNEYGSLPFNERHEFVTGQISAAHSFGITATHELALYCALAIRHGTDFASKSGWESVFADVRCGRLSLTAAITARP